MTKAKKFLALVLSVAMCLTMMVGCFTASAASGTITVGTTTIDVGTAPANVTITISGPNFAAGRFTVNYGTLPAPTVTSDKKVSSEAAGTGLVNVLVESGEQSVDNITTATVTLAFAGLDNLAIGDYAITVSNIDFADYDENPVEFAAAAGKITVQEAAPQHEHSYTATVTKQPTKDETGVMTYTCECGESYTQPIAKPTLLTDKAFATQLLFFGSSVGTRIAVKDTATGGVVTSGYSDYILEIDYQCYGDGYALADKKITKTSAQRDDQTSTGKTHYFYFTALALYEMPLSFDVVIYALNDNGVAVGYTVLTNNLADLALDYIHQYGSEKLNRCMVDMVNFGSAAQQYFAATNPGSDIDGAVLANAKFADYQQYASNESQMPTSFDVTSSFVKNDATYDILNVTPQMQIGASNKPYFSVRATNYDASKLTAVMEYTDAYQQKITQTVALKDTTITTNTAGNVFYKFAFDNLALYDIQNVTTLKIYYDGKLEGTMNYSLGNYISTYIGVGAMKPLLTAAVLFANSSRAQLVG